MTDQGLDQSVSDAELTRLTDRLKSLARASHVTLVLLGDIVDLLRSPKWKECWQTYNKSAPWSAMSSGFRNFTGSPAEKYALSIIADISKIYSGFSRSLNELVNSGRVRIIYVIGNHDYMLQLSPRLREAVCTFLSLSPDTNNSGKPFPTVYADDKASIYATHGNSYDPTNKHRPEEGFWAFGDAIVLRLVNIFASDLCAELGCGETSQIGMKAHQLDQVAPLVDVPVYVRWLADEYLKTSHDKRIVLETWQRIVTELLALPNFKSGYDAEEIQRVRMGLELSINNSFSQLIARYARYFRGHDFKEYAESLAEELNRRYRFIIFGHTHRPMLMPLSFSVQGQQGYYVNTGCWSKVVSRPNSKERGPFASVHVNTSFCVDLSNSPNHYCLSQECHTD